MTYLFDICFLRPQRYCFFPKYTNILQKFCDLNLLISYLSCTVADSQDSFIAQSIRAAHESRPLCSFVLCTLSLRTLFDLLALEGVGGTVDTVGSVVGKCVKIAKIVMQIFISS